MGHIFWIIFANKPLPIFAYFFVFIGITVLSFIYIRPELAGGMMIGNLGWSAYFLPYFFISREVHLDYILGVPVKEVKAKTDRWIFGYLVFPITFYLLALGNNVYCGVTQLILIFISTLAAIVIGNVVEHIILTEVIKYNPNLCNPNELYQELRKLLLNHIIGDATKISR